ncbi:hypothetical protein VW35_14970 [Devosia soli]|uniref:Uncharacterized protein n=1 Tax=Devosia soli TaxID=361041 RepID=A0A0F5L5D9_9HYPH|nr:hypothetical protein [Devosia soli]KKB77450.1 hypothetical protein VW35_14970 [Devosia soli]
MPASYWFLGTFRQAHPGSIILASVMMWVRVVHLVADGLIEGPLPAISLSLIPFTSDAFARIVGKPDRASFYGGAAAGYLDYPTSPLRLAASRSGRQTAAKAAEVFHSIYDQELQNELIDWLVTHPIRHQHMF